MNFPCNINNSYEYTFNAMSNWLILPPSLGYKSQDYRDDKCFVDLYDSRQLGLETWKQILETSSDKTPLNDYCSC